MNILRTENLSKDYYQGKIKNSVIKNISLNISEGEFVSITGPSGSGKSTLLYLLSGMEPKTSGKVYLLGKELDTLKDKEKSKMRRNNIGFVYQFYNLIGEMNVRDNILLPKLIEKEKIDNARLKEIAKLVDIEKYLNYYPHELSGGQQQRVAIARAVYAKPQIIFADEPTGNLDYNTSKNIMELFKKINKETNTTIVQVTHSIEHAKYADRIIEIIDVEISNKN